MCYSLQVTQKFNMVCPSHMLTQLIRLLWVSLSMSAPSRRIQETCWLQGSKDVLANLYMLKPGLWCIGLHNSGCSFADTHNLQACPMPNRAKCVICCVAKHDQIKGVGSWQETCHDSSTDELFLAHSLIS